MNKRNVISFDLTGDFACFRKNDTNDIVYTTYNFIHRPAILGTLGAISGVSGYAQTKVKDKKREVPKYYELFKNVRIAITPLFRNPLPKEILTFNNSSGMANEDGNLLVKEQQLFGIGRGVRFRIYLFPNDIEDKGIRKDLKKNLKEGYSEYPLYLGKNECLSSYNNVTYWREIPLNAETKNKEKQLKISSLIPFEYLKDPFTYDVDLFDANKRIAPRKLVFEHLPVDFDEHFIYKKAKIVWLSQGSVKLQKFENIYKLQNSKSGETIAYFFSGNNKADKDG